MMNEYYTDKVQDTIFRHHDTKKTMFNQYRNTLKKTITLAKLVYYKNIFDRYKHDMKKTWGIISETLNRSVPNSIPDTLTINGEDCSDRQVIADNFNDFFSTIGESNKKKYS